jgi:hypothetical protein
LYWGSDDRPAAKKLRLAQAKRWPRAVHFVEFAGLDHEACNTQEALGDRVVPMVDKWLSRRARRDR